MRPPAPSRRRALGWLAASEFGWGFGVALASDTAIVPLFLAALGTSKTVIGLAPATAGVMGALPLLAAGYVTGYLSRLKPFLIGGSVAAASPFLLLAAFIWLYAKVLDDSILLWVFFAAYGIRGFLLGLLLPMWVSFVAQTAPPRRRGFSFGLLGICFSGGAVAGGAVAVFPLEWLSFPQSFACCFALSTLMGATGIAFLAPIHEPSVARPPQRPSARAYLRQLIAAIRRHPLFIHYLWARPALAGGAVLLAFYAVYAQDRLDAGTAEVALLGPAFFVGTALGGAGLGYLGDRRGYPWALSAAAAMAAAGLLASLVSGSLIGFATAACCAGVFTSGADVGAFGLISALATDAERTALFGVHFLVGVLLSAIVPFSAGVLIDAYGFAPVFVGSAALVAVGIAQLVRLARVSASLTPLEEAEGAGAYPA